MYTTLEDFARIDVAYNSATMLADCPAGPEAWWQALLVIAQMNG